MIPVIKQVQDLEAQYQCHKPIWNTESGWAEPKHFSSEEEAAGYVMRTLLLNWLLGIQRCYWYAWDNHNWSTLDLTSTSSNHMTPAGASYGVIYNWLHGAVLRSCHRLSSGIWICELDRGGTTSKVLWSDAGASSFSIPVSWHVRSISTWTGKDEMPTVRIRIGSAPALLVSK
jgi:hypothetical protein